MNALAYWCSHARVLPWLVMMLDLLSVTFFRTLHISLVHFVYGTLRRQIYSSTFVVIRDPSSFRLLHVVWVPLFQRIFSLSFNFFVDLFSHQAPSSHSHRHQPNVSFDCLLLDFTQSRMHLLYHHLSVLKILDIRPSNWVKAVMLPFFQSLTSCSAFRLKCSGNR